MMNFTICKNIAICSEILFFGFIFKHPDETYLVEVLKRMKISYSYLHDSETSTTCSPGMENGYGVVLFQILKKADGWKGFVHVDAGFLNGMSCMAKNTTMSFLAWIQLPHPFTLCPKKIEANPSLKLGCSNSLSNISLILCVVASVCAVATVILNLQIYQKVSRWIHTFMNHGSECLVEFSDISAVTELDTTYLNSSYSLSSASAMGNINNNLESTAIMYQLCVKIKNPGKISKKMFKWLYESQDMSAPNLTKFLGICQIPSVGLGYLYSSSSKGCVHYVLQKLKFDINSDVKSSLALDAAKGIEYLHRNNIVHGKISSLTCSITQQWNLFIGDWVCSNLERIAANEFDDTASSRTVIQVQVASIVDPSLPDDEEHLHPNNMDDFDFLALFYNDPDYLHKLVSLDDDAEMINQSRKNDIYSYGMLLIEIFTLNQPFNSENQDFSLSQIAFMVTSEKLLPSIRLQQKLFPVEIYNTIQDVVTMDIGDKINMSSILHNLEENNKSISNQGIVETMMAALEVYMTTLEKQVDDRTRTVKLITERVESLLYTILPPKVAVALMQGNWVEPEAFDEVTIFFSDIVGFTNICSQLTPFEVIAFLGDLYKTFDDEIALHDVFKVETIGDAYRVVSGLPNRNGTLHAKEICDLALNLVYQCYYFKLRNQKDQHIKIRVGIYTGPVIAGVVGRKMPRYCLFGESVNAAEKLESSSDVMHIQTTVETVEILRQFYPIISAQLSNKTIVLKNREHETYWILSNGEINLEMLQYSQET